MKIADIKIGARHRKHEGDLRALADSIREQGLLQPIGVTEDNELVFGYRRLMACRDLLWKQEIEARVVHVTSIAAGEFAENEMRKNFTVSERVAILESIKRRAEGRPKKNPEDSQGLTTAEAIQKVGFGNSTTAREARTIVANGIPELVEAVDRGEVAIFSGALVAGQPANVQQEIMKAPEKHRKIAIKNLRGERTAASMRSGPIDRKGKKKPFVRPAPLRLPSFTPQEVDPEFTGSPIDFTDKYGHVQIMTAEQYASSRFEDWAAGMRSLAKYMKSIPNLPVVDHNWLRSPKSRDVTTLMEALDYLRPIIAEAEALLDRATKPERMAEFYSAGLPK